MFSDRAEAGKQLAEKLIGYRGQSVVVLALPRGGVVVGAEVALALEAPLDLVIPRKIGHPSNPEYAICAVTEDGQPICNESEIARIDQTWFVAEVQRQREEAARRRQVYLGKRRAVSVKGRTVIIVDDGVATGLTMRAAIKAVRESHPKKLVVAVPVCPPDTAKLLQAEADELVAIAIPDLFLGSVGAYFQDFSQVDDKEVIRLMKNSKPLA